MKTHLDIKHEGSLGSDDRVRMTFDENSIAHLMSVLTDLYSDPAMAVIREYSTNALDSHRAAGISDPIEVFSPNGMNPVFRVVDHGVGMSLEQITDNFSKYGWSSKRETDDEVGMLGLGCKSALAYTSQFTLIAVKDRKRTMVLVTRDDDGCGAVQVVDHADTDEPNGVEVQIPVKSWASFVIKMESFFRFWEHGSVLIDDEKPDYLLGMRDDDSTLDPDVILSTRLDADYIVMGNVPYPVTYEQDSYGYSRFRLVETRNNNHLHAMVRVPIGTVNFAPSREALVYTKRTIETLHDARAFINSVVLKRAEEEVARCKTPAEAWDAANRWRLQLGRVFRWNYAEIPFQFELDGDTTFKWSVHPKASWNNSPANKHGRPYMNADTLIGYKRIIVGYDKKVVTARVKDQIRQYWEDNKISERGVLLTDRDPGAPWLTGRYEVIDYQTEIKPIALPDDAAPKVGKSLPKHRVVVNGAGGAREIDIDPTKTLVWMKAGDEEWRRGSAFTSMQALHGKDFQLVVLHAARIAKFCRDYPEAVYVRTFVSELLGKQTLHPHEAFAIWRHSHVRTDMTGEWRTMMPVTLGSTSFTATAATSATITYGTTTSSGATIIRPRRMRDRVAKLDRDSILDPDLVWCLTVLDSQIVKDALNRWYQLCNIRDQWGGKMPSIDTPEMHKVRERFKAVSTRYGLLSELQPHGFHSQEDWLTYVNAVYLATTQLKLNTGVN